MISRLFFAMSVGALVACASKPTPITVTGDSGDRASLTGKWVGEYNSPATGRNGSIVFNLSPAGDAVSGVLDAYRDPQCDCPVETKFTGRVNGETIDGTFTTRGSQTNTPQTGTWRVKRTAR